MKFPTSCAAPHGSRAALAAAILTSLLAACQPTVKIEPPDKPIVINLNVKVEQEIRVKVEREVEDLMRQNPQLF